MLFRIKRKTTTAAAAAAPPLKEYSTPKDASNEKELQMQVQQMQVEMDKLQRRIATLQEKDHASSSSRRREEGTVSSSSSSSSASSSLPSSSNRDIVIVPSQQQQQYKQHRDLHHHQPAHHHHQQQQRRLIPPPSFYMDADTAANTPMMITSSSKTRKNKKTTIRRVVVRVPNTSRQAAIGSTVLSQLKHATPMASLKPTRTKPSRRTLMTAIRQRFWFMPVGVVWSMNNKLATKQQHKGGSPKLLMAAPATATMAAPAVTKTTTTTTTTTTRATNHMTMAHYPPTTTTNRQVSNDSINNNTSRQIQSLQRPPSKIMVPMEVVQSICSSDVVKKQKQQQKQRMIRMVSTRTQLQVDAMLQSMATKNKTTKTTTTTTTAQTSTPMTFKHNASNGVTAGNGECSKKQVSAALQKKKTMALAQSNKKEESTLPSSLPFRLSGAVATAANTPPPTATTAEHPYKVDQILLGSNPNNIKHKRPANVAIASTKLQQDIALKRLVPTKTKMAMITTTNTTTTTADTAKGTTTFKAKGSKGGTMTKPTTTTTTTNNNNNKKKQQQPQPQKVPTKAVTSCGITKNATANGSNMIASPMRSQPPALLAEIRKPKIQLQKTKTNVTTFASKSKISTARIIKNPVRTTLPVSKTIGNPISINIPDTCDSRRNPKQQTESDTTFTTTSSSPIDDKNDDDDDNKIMPKQLEQTVTPRTPPRALLKPKSIVAKWNKFAAMEEDGIPAAPRHRTKVAKTTTAMNITTMTTMTPTATTGSNPTAVAAAAAAAATVKVKDANVVVSSSSSSASLSLSPRANLLEAIRQKKTPLKPISENTVHKHSKEVVSSPQKNDLLLAGIRAGVALKKVSNEDKKDETPSSSSSSIGFCQTNALLMKLQARKQECLKRQQQENANHTTSSADINNNDDDDDDW